MANRKDIDKETMFNKIMPSSLKSISKPPSSQETVSSTDDSPLTAPDLAPAATTAVKTKSSVFSNEGGVQFKEKRPLILVNTMEKLVAEKLDVAFEKFNCCKCDRCKKDVAAMALNNLEPRYRVIDPNGPEDTVSTQESAEVSTAVVKAILVVRNHPRH